MSWNRHRPVHRSPWVRLARLLLPALLLPTMLLPTMVQAQDAAADNRAPADAQAPSWTDGQICWAWYEPHSAWYAAHIVASGADGIRVQHFDGFEETVAPARVRRDQLAAGDSVSAYFQQRDGEKWYTAVVIERRGMDVVVEYSDGEQEITWLRWIRAPSAAPEGG